MIGNDIVDLQLANHQSNWQRRGWLQKIFTKTELQYIYTSENIELQIWKFWSMKEAAYKAHQRRFNFFPKYNPKSYQCTLNGAVNVDNDVYKTITLSQDEYVYSIARISSDKGYYSSVYDKKVDVHSKLKEIITKKLNISSPLIYFRKNSRGVPIINIDEHSLELPISITHHGQYSACVVTF
ncbi:4'-phosphopantetheinyl transferase superfamily protein [Aquimarina sp. MAR_2010_214]|uniref:4'-phosphopantetheinyl transferase family protein n=1 Tax=Aquimarina sp. MAR_2010_214 TaxID=1250026 RepID=UPI000C7056EC|nr:4'-phosphopantetheinyl transferase superfamily protein [Aquimarina sp. MAR_2010_214]PKV51330.1 4'-phosphopantetheinyl transferase superfamily protein [Aquimarina sp. MAR_2010_214]